MRAPPRWNSVHIALIPRSAVDTVPRASDPLAKT
jgi:hypothetical protein